MDVEGVLSGCAAKLGLSSLKQEQKEAVCIFLFQARKTFLLCCQMSPYTVVQAVFEHARSRVSLFIIVTQ